MQHSSLQNNEGKLSSLLVLGCWPGVSQGNTIWYDKIWSFIFFFFSLFHEGYGMLPLFISLRGCGAYWGQIHLYSWAKARVYPEWVASSLQDPYWWQWLPHRVPTAHQEQFWGSVSCSRILRHVAQSHPRGAGVSNQQPSDHWSTSSTHWATAAPGYDQ